MFRVDSTSRITDIVTNLGQHEQIPGGVSGVTVSISRGRWVRGRHDNATVTCLETIINILSGAANGKCEAGLASLLRSHRIEYMRLFLEYIAC